jgi:Protein of unknown function (DUF3035)
MLKPSFANRILPAVLAVTAVVLCGCGIGRALGTAKVSPDEFSITTKAPLILPPDYSLKPPPSNADKPDQTDTAADAQRALVGDSGAPEASESPGERALIAAAGAEYADPMIRAVVDQEYAGLADKAPDLADRLIFWDRAPAPVVNAQVNPGAESARIEQQQASGKTEQRVDSSATPAPTPPPGGAVPDKVPGQKPPTIGNKHSHLLDGIF